MTLKIFTELFEKELYCFVGDEKEFAKFIKHCKSLGAVVPDSDKGVDGRDGICWGGNIWICEWDIPLLAHECSHAVDGFIEYLQLEGCTELRAYLLGWMLQAFTKQYERKTKCKTRKTKCKKA